MSVNVVPSVEYCHFHVCVPDTAHVPAVPVSVAPIAAPPLIVGAVVLTIALRPGSRPLPAVVEPDVSNDTQLDPPPPPVLSPPPPPP